MHQHQPPCVWVTRPAGQAGRLLSLLEAAGTRPVAMPLLEIQPPADRAALDSALARLESFDLAVFVSPSALEAVFASLGRPWPADLPAAVVGPGSARRAAELGITTIITPATQFDSEGLLAEAPMLHLDGRKVILFRGDGGRELLPEALQARGAILDIVAAYRRTPPRLDANAIAALLTEGCDAIIISSSEAAQHLFALAGEGLLQRLQSMLYIVPHPRIAASLRARGARHVLESAAGDQGLFEAVCRHFSLPSDQKQ